MSSRQMFEETRDRIQAEAKHFGGTMPERTAIAWSGYIAALLERDHISPADHAKLNDILPFIEDDPVLYIFLGRHDD